MFKKMNFEKNKFYLILTLESIKVIDNIDLCNNIHKFMSWEEILKKFEIAEEVTNYILDNILNEKELTSKS